MASSPSIRPGTAVVALGLLAPPLAGCGYTFERTSRIEAREQALAAAETRERSLQRRIGELTGALQAERRAAQEASEAERLALADVAVLQRRLRTARVQVAAIERSRVVATDAPTSVLGDRPPKARTKRPGGRRCGTRPSGRSRPWRASRAGCRRCGPRWPPSRRTSRTRQRELAGLREQIARERAGGAVPPAGAAGRQPEGGGSPPR